MIKAMKDFAVEVPNLDYEGVHYMYPWFYGSAVSRYSVLAISDSGGGWSGGFGCGGGGMR